jgi:hypothetical protein
MTDTWRPRANWLDVVGRRNVHGDTLEPLEEVASRLHSYRQGDLLAVLSPAARYERGLHPYVLADEDVRLVQDLLAIGDDPAALEEVTRPLDAERLRDLVRRTLVEWNPPVEFQDELHLYVQRQRDQALWLLETVAIGLTAVEVQVSLSGQLPAGFRYPESYPDNLDEYDDPRFVDAEEWWQGDAANPRLIHLNDDLGTTYHLNDSRYEHRGFPMRVLVDGQWEARVYERYTFLYRTGIPPEARELTISGRIDLAIEEPSSAPMPWPTRQLSLGDFSYSIDLTHWWPPPDDDEYREYLRWEDQ